MFNFIGIRDFIDFDTTEYIAVFCNINQQIDTITSQAVLYASEVSTISRVSVPFQITTNQLTQQKIIRFNTVLAESSTSTTFNSVLIVDSSATLTNGILGNFVVSVNQLSQVVPVSPTAPVQVTPGRVILRF